MTAEKPAYPSMTKGARISECGTFRYGLLRRWGTAPPLTFVMLNPSTADAELDDPTIRRCIGFARRDGFGALVVLNLYAYRATKPAALLTCADPVGPENDAYLHRHLYAAVQHGRPVVAAWGTNAKQDRVGQVLDMVRATDWRCLDTTKDGHPRHPLYVRGDQPLVPFASPDSAAPEMTSSDVASGRPE